MKLLCVKKHVCILSFKIQTHKAVHKSACYKAFSRAS